MKRLIRMPTSLHGKTGFRVVPLKIDDLKAFDPFRDALAFGDDPVKIKADAEGTIKFRMGDEKFNVSAGAHELPEVAAVYLICQRKATIV